MEKRKNARIPFRVSLKIESLYKQDNIKIENIHEEFKVINLSKSGLAFLCEHELPLNYYFNAKIIIDDERFFYSVVKIIRVEEQKTGYFYGCEFVGLADILSSVVDEIENDEYVD